MQLPTWDVFIGLAFIIGIAYGFILRRDKTITTLLSTYIAIVIANNFSSYLYDFFNGKNYLADQIWIKSNASFSTVSIAVFLISWILVSGAINSSSNRSGELSILEVVTYSALNIALIITTILSFLPEASLFNIIGGSRFAKILWDFKTLWVILPPIALVIIGFRRK